MKILGIHSSHDAGAAIIENGSILAAINEERLIRKKLYWGNPYNSIKKVLEIAKVRPEEVDYVAIANITPGAGPITGFDKRNFRRKVMDKISYFPSIFGTNTFSKFYKNTYSYLRKGSAKDLLKSLKLLKINAPIKFIEHHKAHAVSAFYTSPFNEDTLVITTDGAGDGYCATISLVDSNFKLKRIKAIPFFHSPASIYGYATYNMGFTPGKHEGKLTGLAAYGNPKKTYELYSKIMTCNGLNYKINLYPPWGFPATKKLHELMIGQKREDIAAGLQKRCEDICSKLVKNTLKKYPRKNIALAGGFFANVRINQKIAEIPGVGKVYIHPHMGDGGLAVGSALDLYYNLMTKNSKKIIPQEIDNVYFGPEYSNDEIERVLIKNKMKYKYHKNVEEEIAQLLKIKKIVGRFNGRMEYGPRALGNRSILADPTDKTINDWLNKRLKRSEFMPFAPSIMKEHVKKFYNNFDSGEIAAQFMTVTFDVKKEGVKKAPAVSHIDNTARPQTVTKKQNESYYKILKIYNELTGLPIFVNTSFNMHEEPIICSPEDAVRAFKLKAVDYLAIGNFICK